MTPLFFETQEAFREWLTIHHTTETEVFVGFYRVNSNKASMTWSESVDQALCFGWIDGVRRTIDHESYSLRFTPRKSNSIWSNINIKKVEKLIESGLMMPAGLQAFALRKESKSGIYSHEKEPSVLHPDYEKLFKKNKAAWDFFNNQAPYYKKVMIHLIMTAKQEKTQLSRLEKLIKASEEQKRIT